MVGWMTTTTRSVVSMLRRAASIDRWDRSVDLWDRSVDLWDRSVDLWDRSVDLWDRSVDLWDRSVDQSIAGRPDRSIVRMVRHRASVNLQLQRFQRSSSIDRIDRSIDHRVASTHRPVARRARHERADDAGESESRAARRRREALIRASRVESRVESRLGRRRRVVARRVDVEREAVVEFVSSFERRRGRARGGRARGASGVSEKARGRPSEGTRGNGDEAGTGAMSASVGRPGGVMALEDGWGFMQVRRDARGAARRGGFVSFVGTRSGTDWGMISRDRTAS